MKFSKLLQRAFCSALLGAGLVGIVSAPAALRAQSTTEGAIAGTVTDPTGAIIPSAAVTLHNNDTNAEIKLASDSSGYFKAPLVSPGTYTVTISASGFGDYKATGVAVTVGSLTELHPELKTGSAVESVQVSGDAPVLQFESPEISSTLTSREILDLPLNGGRWSDLALLTPGALSDANGFGLIVFRGISPLLNNVEIDGADDNQAFFSEERGRTREGYSTSQIGIAEFQVNTGVYSAEYGRAAGGVINSVTKSGTNQIHGQAYFLDRDNDWGAINPFTTFTSVTEPAAGGAPNIVTGVPFQPKDWRKRWGFGAGGPLIKDKLFWFYAYDQYRRNFPGVAKPSSPAAFFNQWADLSLDGNGTCSATSTKATFTPAEGSSPSSGDYNACVLAYRVFGGNYATAAANYDQLLFGSAVSSITGLTNPGLLDDTGTTPRTGDEVLNTPKLDWQINDRLHASFLYHRLRWDSPGGVQTQTSNNYATDTFGTDFVKLDYGMAKLDWIISPSLTNQIRFQYGKELNDEGQQPYSSFTSTYLNNNTGTPVQLGIDGTPYSTSNNAPSTNDGFTAGMPYYSFRTAYPAEWKDQVGDTGYWTHRNHTLKFGFDLLRNSDEINNLYESNGVYTYTTFGDFFADILQPSGTCDSGGTESGLGKYACYYNFTQGLGTPVFSVTTIDYGFFAQDDWKITPRLTLNLGLRYDYEHVPPPYPSLINTSLLTTTFPYAPAQIGNKPDDKNNFGPRVGLSWDPYGTGHNVVRAGYGLYYGRILNGVVLNAYEAAGSPNGQYTIPGIYGEIPNGATAPAFPQIIPNNGSYSTPSVDFFAKNFQNSQIHEFDFSVQHEFGHGSYLTVNYMGALGRELPNFLNINLNPASLKQGVLTIAPATTGGSCGPLACGTQIPTAFYTKTLNTSHYGSITEVVSNINSSYHAAVVEFQNRGNKYAQFDVNYTWSHALDYNQNQATSPSTNNWWDPNGNARANYGNSAYNVPNRFVGWALLQYPGAHHGWQRYVEDGWHLNPVLQVQNGLPYSAAVSGTITGAYSSGLTGSGNSGYLLQLGRNTFQQPTTLDLDVRLQKDIHIGERFNVELVAEAFNLVNHLNVTSLNSTAYSIGSCAASGAAEACKLSYQPFSAGSTGITGQSGFGAITNADSTFVYSQRQVQLGMKLDF
ncbi:TonB-dependent receptor domain-containing protein [Terracidiphilus gabretensis]|uniref:TonB-dependent receptor domain-containing protein n=1 Tax=Terracidiphilus gabretensis TaxID=1577687 RepID=UPI00071BB49E|nr:TonB-dependent receptor [Terracidiphilus gabretensis]